MKTRACRQIRRELLSYVEATQLQRDGTTTYMQERVREHLRECPTCRAEMKQIAETLLTLRSAPGPPIPLQLSSLIWEKIELGEKRRFYFTAPRLVCASLTVLFVVAIIFFLRPTQPAEQQIAPSLVTIDRLLGEQERWVLILSHTLCEQAQPGREHLYEAGEYVLSRLDRSTKAFREAVQQGGLDPSLLPEYEEALRRQIRLLKEFYFQASSS